MYTKNEGRRFTELMRRAVTKGGGIKPKSLSVWEYNQMANLYLKVVGIPFPDRYEAARK